MWTLGYSGEALGATRDQIALAGHYTNTLVTSDKTWWVVHIDLAFPFDKNDDVDSVQLLFTLKDRF